MSAKDSSDTAADLLRKAVAWITDNIIANEIRGVDPLPAGLRPLITQEVVARGAPDADAYLDDWEWEADDLPNLVLRPAIEDVCEAGDVLAAILELWFPDGPPAREGRAIVAEDVGEALEDWRRVTGKEAKA